MGFREVKLPSGATLHVASAPFAESKALYKALMAELKQISLGSGQDMGDLVKNIFCAGFSSPEIEKCLDKCFERCLYDNGKDRRKIDKDTFEPIESREDYTIVCFEVTQENVRPFGKSLMQLYFHLLASAESVQALRSKTSPSSPTSNSQ